MLDYDWTFFIEEPGRNFFPAVIFGFLFDEELAQEILVKKVETPRAEFLQDCATHLNVTTRRKWTSAKVDSILIVDERFYLQPFRWMLSTKLGGSLKGYLKTFYEDFRHEERVCEATLRVSCIWLLYTLKIFVPVQNVHNILGDNILVDNI